MQCLKVWGSFDGMMMIVFVVDGGGETIIVNINANVKYTSRG